MKRLVLIMACLGLSGALPAAAQDGGSRYVVSETEDGIVRVDRETGEVSICSSRNGEWACELVADDRNAMLREIDGLREENARLRRRLGAGTSMPGTGGRDYGALEPRLDPDRADNEGVMTREEVDRTMDTLEYMLERLVGAAERFGPDHTTPPGH